MSESNPPKETLPPKEEPKQNPSKRKKMILWTTIVLLLIAVAVFLYWLFVWRFEEYTDDAYVGGNRVELTPQVPGIVTAIHFDNTDLVKEGDLLVEIDQTDYELAFESAKNQLAETVRDVVQLFLKVEELEAQLEVKEAELIKSQQDYQNRIELVSIGAVSKEEFEHIEAALKSAESSTTETFRSLQSAYAQVEGTTIETHPMVKKQIDQVKDAWVNLSRCQLISPVTGYIAQRTVQLGEWVSKAEPLLSIVPVNELWVDANFKEIQLSKMRIGQPALVRSDIYGRSVHYKAKVVGINPGTGNVFSALPPQNATGNWIKIVQRVPVRISLSADDLKSHPLWLGLSMEVTVDIHDTSGPMLAKKEITKPRYETAVYERQEEGVEGIIHEVIEMNKGCYGSCRRGA